MKKLVFIMPLMVISLLASCSGGDNPGPTPDPKTVERTVSFNIPDCKMYYGDTEIKSSGTKIEIPDVNPYFVKFSVKTNNDNYMKPSGVTLDKATDYTFYKEYGDLYINLQSDIAVTGVCDTYKTLEECAWAGISRASKDGVADEIFAVGQTKTVMVNNQPHKVRIIGFNQDVDAYGDPIGITFEFATLISDSDGYSIATQWNDTNNTDIANHNYLDSSVRMALVGEKQEKGHILWAQYSDQETTTWSSTYANKTVLNMIEDSNPGFTNIIVAPKKTVQCKVDGEWTDTPIVNNSGEYDKLFLLSPEEIGNNATREGAYTYYQEKDDAKLKSLRIKKQFNGKDIIKSTSTIPKGSAGQEYQGDVYSFAGYNYSSDNTGGGNSWLRSPYTDGSNLAWIVNRGGGLSNRYVCNRAFAVAPAFCI